MRTALMATIQGVILIALSIICYSAGRYACSQACYGSSQYLRRQCQENIAAARNSVCPAPVTTETAPEVRND